jgi:hypothetical protein
MFLQSGRIICHTANFDSRGLAYSFKVLIAVPH